MTLTIEQILSGMLRRFFGRLVLVSPTRISYAD